LRDIDPTPPAIVRQAEDLASLAAQINEKVKAGMAHSRQGVQDFRDAGVMLAKAKKLAGHGRWLGWLKKNCPETSERQAQRYMKLAEVKSDSESDLQAAFLALSCLSAAGFTWNG
jgi:hypothetical protein